jgi:hypothetical protein
MEDINRNSRTLIVSFVVAIMFLVPLRFVEVGQSTYDSRSDQVLGETTAVQSKVVLPNAQVVLEAPYNEIESQGNCISKDEANATLKELKAKVANNQLNESQLKEMIGQMLVLEQDSCK